MAFELGDKLACVCLRPNPLKKTAALSIPLRAILVNANLYKTTTYPCG